MIIQVKRILAPVALLGLIAAQLWVSILWIRADGSLGDGVCCSFTAPVFEILRADGTDQLGWPWSTYRRSMGLLVWPALGTHKLFGPDPDFLLWLNLACVVLIQLLMYDLGKRLSGSVAGLVAAGLFPMIPAVTLMARRWDAMVPQHLLLVLGASLAVRSMGFYRAGATLAFGAVAAAGSVLSARETDNLLFMAAIGAIATGTALYGLLSPNRIRALLGTLVLAAVMSLFMIEYAFPLVDFAYFQDEMSNKTYVEGASRLSLSALTAYPLRLYTDDFTPWLIAPFLVSLVPFFRRGSGRTVMAFWLVLPLLALSLVGKKNYYYAAVVYPVIPLITGIGLSRLRPRAIGLILAAVTLAVGWAQFSARSLPSSTFPSSLAQVKWTGDAGPQKHLFQGIVPLNLGPQRLPQHHRAIAIMEREIRQDSCACPDHTLFIGQGDISDLHLSVAIVDPCMAFSAWPRLDHPPSVGRVIVESRNCTEKPPPAVMKMGFELASASGTGEGCVALWKRTRQEPGRFCGTKGSPPE